MTTHVLLGRYELTRLIGRGGMAEVWEARDTRLGRRVAVKTVNLAAAHDARVGERLQREAVAIASLRHPDIVTVHDAGVEGDTAYLVMELIEGRDLAEVLRGGPLPVPEALRVVERVAGALSAAHAAGIVHRDVKPANVLLHGDDVTVVDFGIAAAAQAAGASLTEPGTVVGTADYMAPEQAEGAEVTPASDVYALGCLMTAALTGRPPFTGAHPLDVLRQHAAASPPGLAAQVPELPRDLDALVAAMLAKDPADRPSTAAVLQTLRAPRHHLPTAAVADPDGATEVLPATGTTRTLPAAAVAAAPAAGREPAAGAPTTGRGTESVTATAGPGTESVTAVAPARSGRGRPRWVVGGAAVAGVAGIAVAIALLGGGDPTGTEARTPAAGESPAPAASPTPGEPQASAPAQQESAPAQAAPPSAAPPADSAGPGAEGGMSALLASLQADEETRTQLEEQWDELTEVLAEGKADKVTDRAKDLSKRIDELAREGELGEAEAQALQDELAAAVGTELESSGKGNGGDDKGEGDDKGDGDAD
ncbi:protein kinase [Georgenia sp. EYE_87]|uniref:serine/threonine-protein kinase n=1 Tax=Georgenia sp. EYE_87 TaxID=2853448 RepID=UPI002006CCB5|nr:serine/threonine-protein kinase [Georgenia sp. EYE_87]MCK6212265.1 protein kinase [Georgenia sp. EYE_87]